MQSTQSDLDLDLELTMVYELPCGVNHNFEGAPACSVHVTSLFTFECEPIELFSCQSGVDYAVAIAAEECGNCPRAVGECWHPRSI